MKTDIQDYRDYSATYIQEALCSKDLHPPDLDKAQDLSEVVHSIYTAYKLGGHESVKTAWQTIRRIQPSLAYLETRQPSFINANDLSHLPAPVYLIPEYPIYERGFNLIFGASNVGKTFFALDISGRVAQEHVVIYIAGEGLFGFDYRWICWKNYYNLDSDQLVFFTRPLQIMDEDEVNEFVEQLLELSPALVVIDTLARSAIGIEENSAKEIGTFIQRCDVIRTRLDCAILLIHHTGKSGQMRGSTALYAAADSVLALKNEDNVITVRNDYEGDGKNKYNAPEPRKYYEIVPHTVDDIEGAVIVERDHIKLLSTTEQLTPNQVSILTALCEIDQPASVQMLVDVSKVAQSSLYRNLKKLEEMQLIDSNSGQHQITAQGLVRLEDV